MYANQDQEEVQYDLDKPKITVSKNTWRSHQNYGAIWNSFREGLQFYQTRSNAIALLNTLPAICVEKAVYMKTGEYVSAKFSNLQDYREPYSRRICIMDDSAVQKEDSNRKEIVKRMIQQFENHPCHDSLKKDLINIEEFNPFSEKSKALITSMDNTEFFELCKISSEIQCFDCSWRHRILHLRQMHAANRNRQLNKARYDVLSIHGYVIKKKKRILPTVPDMEHRCGSACITKHMICLGKSANTKIVTGTFWTDGIKMTDIGWTEERIMFEGHEEYIDLMLLQDGDTILFHNAFVFIFVFTMATKQRLVVNVELGFVQIFILEWTVIFLNRPRVSDFISLAGNLTSWQSTVWSKQYTYRAHIFSLRILSACLSQLVVAVVQVHTAT